jgi:diguanylate cyclase (GGDEF)-like protein
MSTSIRSREFINRLREQAAWSTARLLFEKGRGILKSYREAGTRIVGKLRLDEAVDWAGKTCIVGWNRLRQAWPGRSLIGEILALQLFFALLVGSLAIVGLWWTSTWAIEDNLRKWGERWISELDDLGIPLYSTQDEDKYLRVENYINSFPEISFVRYYSPAGQIVFEDFPLRETSQVAALDPKYLSSLATDSTSERTYPLESTLNDSALVRISKPIWTESFLGDGLLGLDLSAEQDVQAELVGFIELGLNFSAYQAQLSRNIVISSLLGFVFLMVLTIVSGAFLRRALKPLSQLQQPLKELAKGKTDFSVQTSGHREIVAIADALNTTVSSLNERDKKLWQLANNDSLTGLMNRHQFSETLIGEIEKVSQKNIKSALLFVDLDQFKYVNDTLGHAAGDRLLKQAAEHLKNGIRKEDIVSRFGGDEFTILLSDVKQADVKAICTSLVQDMRDYHFHEAGHTFNIPCSIGVAMISSGSISPAELLARADMACHEAKSRGRNRFHLYKTSGAEKKQMTADIGWSQQIQKALKEDLFVIHYQPIVDVRSGLPTHYEVLLRMQTGAKRLVPPAAFLPAASRFGLMTDVDQWVIRNALQGLAKLKAAGQDLTLTLNISGNIFEDADLYACIEDNLKTHNLPAESIVLEITEQVAVRNIATAADQIAEISKLGCKFAIDDFGAGYSSYTYLKSLPVHYIKIDGSFIKNLATDLVDQTIVRSISQIAKATNKKTIAEHVADAATFRSLYDLGVDFAQGYYVGRPAARPSQRKIPVQIETAQRRTKKAG